MPYDANPAATHDPTASVVVPVNWLDLINANFAAIGAAWTAFTPTWTGTTTNPLIGNGTIAGAYRQIGKTLDVRYRIAMGATTTYGVGTWKLRLPNSLSAVAGTTQLGQAWATDFGTGYVHGVALVGTDPSADFDDIVISTTGSATLWGQLAPFTWAASDILVVKFTALEVA